MQTAELNPRARHSEHVEGPQNLHGEQGPGDGGADAVGLGSTLQEPGPLAKGASCPAGEMGDQNECRRIWRGK